MQKTATSAQWRERTLQKPLWRLSGRKGLKDELVRDIIICGLADNRLRECLLRDPGLTLEKTIELGQAAEETKRHMKEMHHDSKSVDSLNRSRPSKGARKKVSSSKNKSDRQEEIIAKCKFCVGQHKRGQCPAYNKRCNNCQKLNHFAKCCTRPKLRTIKHVDADSSSEDESELEFFIGSIQATEEPSEIAEIKELSETEVVHDSACQDEDVEIFAIENYTPGTDWSMNLETNGSDVTYKLDTGAQVNVMPKSEYLKLIRKPELKVTRVKLTAYSGSSIPVLGKCILRISHKKRMVPIMFIVADTNSPSILGLNTCEKLNLIKRVMVVNEDIPEVVKEFSDCFGEMGTLPKVHHIHVDLDIKPVVHPPGRVPIALHAKLRAELGRMESLGVIDRVTEPTDWVNSLIVVQKPNGQIRVSLDPKDLNKAIKGHHYQLPTAEDILSCMSGAKFFSELDASSGYWQTCVDKESSKLLTFNSPFRRYKFNRLPFGVHHASEVFQADVAEILEGLEGVQNAQDDIIIWGSTKAEHDQRLRDAMMQIRKSGMKLNKTKCVFSAREITFLGHTLTDVGIKPDLRKVTAITEMPNPQSEEDLRRFLGMVNYLTKFVPDLSDITAPLRELLEKDAQWCFEAAHENAIEWLKSIITSEPVLKYFDPQLPTKVSTDASKSGLRATLEQKHGDKWCPVAFASCALTQAEYSYCPIEKKNTESLHEFVYGQLFEVENDHQPLKSIFNKPISKAPPRIQRFLLRLYRYDFTLNYTPGKIMVVSDALSGAYLKDQKPEISDAEMNYMIHSVISSLPISDEKLKQFQTETSKDETLRTLHKYVMNGWPKNKNDINPTSMPYFSIRDEISVANGLVLKGERIIVPLSMRKEMKQIIHSGHQGIEKCKARAREALYWTGMSAEIADIVSACRTCQEHRNYQQCEELLNHEVPREPWIKVGADLFTLKRKNYLLVVDYFSKFCEISLLADTSSPTIITHMKSIFALHGIPKLVVSDNQLDTK